MGQEGRGGISSWVLSGSHHAPPRRVQLWPRGRKLDTGLSTAGMLWEGFVYDCVCVSLSLHASGCVEKVWLTGGRLLSRMEGLSLNPPHLTPHYLTHCALWPDTSSHSALHTRTHKTHARTGTSTHMASIKHGCTAPRKKGVMEIQNDGTYPHFVPLSVLIIANTCTPPHPPPSKEGHTWIAGGGTHTWAERSATTWLSGEVFNVSFCCQPPPHQGIPWALIRDTA